MSKSFCVFVDDMYYCDFVALYNSWKYYEHKTPLKVYSHNNLSKEKINIINKFCEVILIQKPKHITSSDYFGKQLFKYVGMLENMEDLELLIDADTLFLSNTDHLFESIGCGNVIGATENDYTFNSENYYKNVDDFNYDKNILKNYIQLEYLNNFFIGCKNRVLNGGLLGFNKSIHSFLLQKTIDILSNPKLRYNNPIFQNEQYMINFLMYLYNTPTQELDRKEWMNTWEYHKNPKKMITIDRGKFKVLDAENNYLKFYHFTGGIGMPYGKANDLRMCRPHQLYESQSYETQFTRDDVEKLWYNNFENPILLLYEYFYNKGLN